MWTRVLIVGLLSLVVLCIATLIESILPQGGNGRLQGAAVDRLMQIIANAMLAVTVFSLTVMVTVHRNTSSQFTPRAHLLIMEGSVTQNTLAAFIGTYVTRLSQLFCVKPACLAMKRQWRCVLSYGHWCIGFCICRRLAVCWTPDATSKT
ncbi:DUF2254 family protein [Ascidiaceihabitans sp.]|uniref:DUF2254 family protein n=1 Tax=Ascidiaceihabitans sp. TaxID=1872644 RepID=UPI003299165C